MALDHVYHKRIIFNALFFTVLNNANPYGVQHNTIYNTYFILMNFIIFTILYFNEKRIRFPLLHLKLYT